MLICEEGLNCFILESKIDNTHKLGKCSNFVISTNAYYLSNLVTAIDLANALTLTYQSLKGSHSYIETQEHAKSENPPFHIKMNI